MQSGDEAGREATCTPHKITIAMKRRLVQIASDWRASRLLFSSSFPANPRKDERKGITPAYPSIALAFFKPATSLSTSSLVLYTAKEARAVPGMPKQFIKG